jgi:peptidoglycan-associated lipoprotein
VEPNAKEDSASKPIEEPRKEVIHFPFDRATPVAADMPLLTTVTDFLLTHPEVTVGLEGHTCRLGSEAYNDRLGQRRATAIKNHLIEAGIAARRISRLSSYGEHRPVCLETIEDCLRQNRRAVLLLFKPPKN